MTPVDGDPDARDAIGNDLDTTLIVEAAAGTGKTTELVKRIVRVLMTRRARVDRIVAVTFTEKAAGELKLRLREALERARVAVDEAGHRAALDAALSSLEEAHVNTIHGFCGDLLRERPVEACVDPLFRVLTEGQAERLYDEGFNSWMQDQLERPPEGVRRALRRTAGAGFAGDGRDDGPIGRLRRAGGTLREWRDFPTPWTREPFDRAREVQRLLDDIHVLAARAGTASSTRDPLFLGLEPVRRLSEEVGRAEGLGLPDYDAWEARLVDLSRDRTLMQAKRGSGASYGPEVPRSAVWDARESLQARLQAFRAAADADLAALLHDELRGSIDRYERLKARSGTLDFLDLLLKTRNLLVSGRAVRTTFQDRFTHLFVDEFQDTDPLQAEILLLLACADPDETDWRRVRPVPGKLFIVGDPKQSIYRFRRADVGVYRQVCEQLIASGARSLTLSTSFRSRPAVQRCINAAFERKMDGDAVTLQASYVRLTPSREDRDDQPAVVVLPVPEPYARQRVAAYKIEESLPVAVAGFIEWLVSSSGWTVTERRAAEPSSGGTRAHAASPPAVPVQARHVCVLFRRFVSFGKDMTRPYVQAIEARGIPHVLVGGRSFHEREEVDSLRAALTAVEWPDDELSIFATLKGMLFAIGDEELFEYRHSFGRLHPFRAAADPPARLRPIVEALDVLRELHRRRNYRPVAETIGRLLEATRAHVGLVLRPNGEQALANVLHIAELARQYELEGGISFRGFVDRLQAEAKRAQAGEAPILEEGSDGVRLMTVHRAKGLEFPIVILADMTAKLSRADADRYIDADRRLCALRLAGWSPRELVANEPLEVARDSAEGVRIAYVAATRARDLLVVPAVGDEAWDVGWLDPLNAAVYPQVGKRREPASARGCPPFRSKDTVLSRPTGDPAGPHTVAPGGYDLHDPTGEPYSVVWWDPRALDLSRDPSFGVRHENVVVRDVPSHVVDEGLARYREWRADRDRAVAAGSRPSVTVCTATEWIRTAAANSSELDAPVALLDVERAADRPYGPRFGSLVHALLATLPLDAPREVVERFAQVHGRVLDAAREEVEAACEAVGHVLAHPLLLRARDAQRRGACRREAPCAWVDPAGAVVEGNIDLMFDEAGRLTVVDFKTDRDLKNDVDVYRRQVALYCTMVRHATGKPAEGVLVRV